MNNLKDKTSLSLTLLINEREAGGSLNWVLS
jgi:hypothetical protein